MRKKRKSVSWCGPSSPSALLIFVFDPIDRMTYLSYKGEVSKAPTNPEVKRQVKNHFRLTNEGLTLSSEMPQTLHNIAKGDSLYPDFSVFLPDLSLKLTRP